MTLRIVDAPARRGLAWVSQAFAQFLRRPLAFSLLFLVFLVAAMVLLAIPYAGAVLVLASLPLLTLGFMIATRAAQENGSVHAGQMIEPLMRDGDPARRSTLVRLCLLYALATAMVMWGSDAIDGGAFERLQILLASARTESTSKEIDELLADPSLRTGVLVRFGLSALLSVPFWHAPALVWWHGQGVAQALFSSTLACWRNKGAFLLYGLAWVGTVALFGISSGLLFSLLGAPQLLVLAAVPAGLMFSTAFYISLYYSFADCFAQSGDEPSTTASMA
ncbi:MAG: BPSS1780 family membrane protein [Aquincola sp.]|nr:BPSS1780 family membrane protein [Aquincola sp.]MDH4287903.1 BPSS1780 family membrane protein [Aquincola sp.]MDH5329235.1 BPSS1780 family membrane protein [Aquincola sp.]